VSEIKAALEAIETRFRNPSKQRDAARYIVRQNRIITSEEKKKIVEQIPIATSTLSELFSELRKMGLYPPQEASESTDMSESTEKPMKPSPQAPEAPEPSVQEYATKEDLETLRDSINYLAAVMSGVDPENPGEDEEEEEEVEVIPLEEVELIPQEEILIEDPSLIKKTIFLKPITMLYFDLARAGAFPNYVGTNEPGPFTYFTGNLSDFFNNMTEDYSNRLYDIDIGLKKFIEEIEVS